MWWSFRNTAVLKKPYKHFANVDCRIVEKAKYKNKQGGV